MYIRPQICVVAMRAPSHTYLEEQAAIVAHS
jgi:hypothetical protein